MGGVAEASGDAAGEFDQAVDALGAAVVGAAGGEIAQERMVPFDQGPAQAAISGIGQVGKESMICSASSRPATWGRW